MSLRHISLLMFLAITVAMAPAAAQYTDDEGGFAAPMPSLYDTSSTFRQSDTSRAGSRTPQRQAGDKGEKLPVVKRRVNYKEQVFLALGMMLFVAFMMSSADTFNPR